MDFKFRLFKPVFIPLVMAVVMGGCVSSGTYQKKEQESQTLSRNLDESRKSYAELQQKYTKLEGELTESINKGAQLADNIKGLTINLADSKVEKDRLGQENTILSDKLKMLAVNYVDARAENEKLKLANLSLSEKVKQFSDELEQLKIANEKLSEAVKVDNLLKTVGEHFEALQHKVNELSEENTKLKQTLKKMRSIAKQTSTEASSRETELKAPESSESESGG